MPKVKTKTEAEGEVVMIRLLCWYCGKTHELETTLTDNATKVPGYRMCPNCGHITFQAVAPPPIQSED